MRFNKTYLTRKPGFVVFFVVLIALGIYGWLQGYRLKNPVAKLDAPPIASQQLENYPELEDIKTVVNDFEQLKVFFLELSQKKNARYGFQILKRFNPGPNIDLHLLGHVVGDVLYKQEGVDGMTACNNDFRNACSHAIVVGLFSDKGEVALPEITEACRKAPGGKGAYTMCFHGLGHGILSAVGYDMEQLSKLCEKTGTQERSNSEVVECIGGSVMEIVGGGFHDRHLWEKQRVAWLDKKKPLALCQQKFIPDYAKFMCYEYITPFLFESVGANLGSPIATDFEKAFKFCEAIPLVQGQNRDACFGGFGKEFDGLVASRDIRKNAIENISQQGLKQIYEWCLLSSPQDGKAACVVHALNSLYWGGENNRGVSVRFCHANADEYLQKSCFMALITAVGYYINDNKYRQEFCAELPEGYIQECRDRFGIKSDS